MREVKKGVYKHFKKGNNGQNNYCLVLATAQHSESGEELVVYQLLTTPPFEIKARPIKLFLEKVNKEKYPESEQEYKFEYVGE